MPNPLTGTEKAYFDTIRQVAKSARPDDLRLMRMTLDGEDAAVIVQRVIDSQTAETLGFQPLALILDDDLIQRLRAPDGSSPEKVKPTGVEGAA